MSSFPERLLALAQALYDASPEGDRHFAEAVQYLDVHGLMSPEAWNEWRSAAASADAYGILIKIFNLQDEPFSGNDGRTRPVKIRISKPNTATTFHAFRGNVVEDILRDEHAAGVRRILVARGVVPFETISCAFAPWTGATTDDMLPDPLKDVHPSSFVYAAGEATIPSAVGPLVLAGQWPSASEAFTSWARVATEQLPLTFADEARAFGSTTEVVFRRSRTLVIQCCAAAASEDALRVQTEIAQWLFADAPSVETRREFFGAEVTRIWPPSAEWFSEIASLGPRALEGAKSANRLFLDGKTGDVLKTLGDLRKAMLDEVARTTQMARDLGSGLWRDVVIAVTALTARMALSANSVLSDAATRTLVFFAMAFLVVSFSYTVIANERTLRILAESRAKWRSHVYQFVSDADTEELLMAPTRHADALYRGMQWKIGAVYVVLVALLVCALGVVPQISRAMGFGKPTASPSAASSARHPGAPTKVKRGVLLPVQKHT